MNKKKVTLIVRNVVMGLVVSSFVACGGGTISEEEKDTGMADEMLDSMEDEEPEQEKKMVYYATPSMVEIAGVIKSTGAVFSSDVLNDPANKKQYTTQFKRALNMGVYGADLAYSAMFEETQTALDYLKTVKEMADDMGMDGVFEASLIEQIQSNITNKDSLLAIISDFYWSTDAYLEDNDRSEAAALIVAGGWLEATYIATNMAINSPDNMAIRERVAEQKLIVKNLVMLVKGKMNAEGEETKNLLAQLEEVKAILDNVAVESNTGNVISDEENQSTEIQNASEVTMSEEALNELHNKIKGIRNQLIH